MSILYHFSVLDAEKNNILAEDIIHYCFDSREDNFRSDLRMFGENLEKEPSKIKGQRFVKLMKEYVKNNNVTTYEQLYEKTSKYIVEDIREIREAYKPEADISVCIYRGLMWNNLFAEILNKNEDILEVMKLRIEIASIHPDAGFPKYRMNATCTKNDERRFLTRVLSDVYNNLEKNPIVNWFEKRGGSVNEFKIEEGKVDEQRLIWGFERHKGIKIKTSKSFWNKTKDCWWSYLENQITELSDNKPYEIVTYDVILHPKWFEETNTVLEGVYESTAHWM
ncbi:hypothetical protein [Vallitalea maricola]|uniref:Uncharacterized protein n=1 Tax=Vallitalea maricola TaxID=3074433 RepID=A0ACB5UMS0_9FIRM|nr:hypothetical protein AN2V17_30700 [Vallitalea sp. AN17-2]